MKSDFKDIKILSIDVDASRAGDESPIMVWVVFRLSSVAPSLWEDYFNNSWREHWYGFKRRAFVSGACLDIYCVPDEIKTDHLPELKRVIAKTNAWYRQAMTNAQKDAEVRTSEVELFRTKLREMNDNLDYE